MAIQQELADLIKELGKNNTRYSELLPLGPQRRPQPNEGSLLQSEVGNLFTRAIPLVPDSKDSSSQKRTLDATGALGQLLTQLSQASTANKENADRLKDNTRAILSSNPTKEPSSSSTIAETASTFASGLGLSPILSGLIHLFTGASKPEAPLPLVKYALPTAIRADAGLNSDNSISLIDRNLLGSVRSTTQQAPTQVTVQIQALDSRSILDRSDDIAKAVREAMLNSSALNDVIQDL